MKSQEYWGLGFIIVGVILLLAFLLIDFIVALIYGIPLIIIGVVIIIFRNRESKIDK